MESQPQNPEFRNNLENLHPCRYQYCFHSALKYMLITGMMCVDMNKLRVSEVHKNIQHDKG